MIIQSFDKSIGYSQLQEKKVGPRITLRYLAAYKTFGVILLSFIMGQLIIGTPSYGFLLLILISLVYLLILALIDDVPI